MAAFIDNALRVFGTPERELRRRWLHPLRFAREETDDDDTQAEDSTTSQELSTSSSPPPPNSSSSSSMTDYIIGLLYHLTAVSFFVYMKVDNDGNLARLKQEKGLVLPHSDEYGGMWKFISHLNMHALIGYFVLALLCDLLPWAKEELQKFLDFIFTTTIFPCALMVSSMFWMFTLFLREFSVGTTTSSTSMILEALPPYIIHALHTAVGFAVVIEVLLVRHTYSSNTDAVKTMFIWNSSYAFWIYWCYYHAGTFPYPLFYNLGPYLIPLVFLLFFIVSIVSYFFGKTLTSWGWTGEQN